LGLDSYKKYRQKIEMKKWYFLFLVIILLGGVISQVRAANIEAVLDESAGASSFIIQNSGLNQVFGINSDGQTTIIDNAWLGFGASAGRIEFDDQPTDEINFLSCKVGIGTPDPDTSLDVDGDIRVKARGDVRFADSDSSNYVAFQSPTTVSSDTTWTLPSADGSNGQVLSTNGAGTLYWRSVVATGSYTGNGASQSITVGWQPKHIIIISDKGKVSIKNDFMPDDDFSHNGTWETTGGITITSTGFDVGDINGINKKNDTFYWTAYR